MRRSAALLIALVAATALVGGPADAIASATPDACATRAVLLGDEPGPSTHCPAVRRAVLPRGFVRLADVAPDILQEMRYAGVHNFVGRPITGYDAADCWLTRPAALALTKAQAAVRSAGYSLKVWDCYRPQRAVDDFVAWAADPSDDVMKGEFYPRLDKAELFPLGLIAAKSGHTRGSTVDLTLVPLGDGVSPEWKPGQPLVDCVAPAGERFPDTSIDMGTGFDCFDPLAAADAPGLSADQREHRDLLRAAMTAAGFVNYPLEWWHFTLSAEPYPSTYFTAPIHG